MADKHLRANASDFKDGADREIFQAVIEGNVRNVDRVLKDKSDFISQKAKDAALILACRGRRKQSAKLLLNSGANVEFQDRCGNTALMVSAEQGLVDFAELLIRMGADVNAVNANGDTALILSINEGLSVEMLNLLIKAKADVQKGNNEGVTAMTRAIRTLDLDAISMLLRNGAIYDRDLETLAVDMGLDSAINHLTTRKCFESTRDVWRGLQSAAKSLDIPSMKQFLGCKLDIDTGARYGYHMTDLMNTFIESLPDTLDDSHIEMTEAVLRHASSSVVGERLQSLMLFAVEKNGNFTLIEIILKHILSQHKRENVRWAYYDNPLTVSVQHGRCHLIPLFLDNGFEVESPVTSSHDKEPVPYAVHHNDLDNSKPFIARIAKVSLETLVREAIRCKQPGCLKFLLNKYPLDMTPVFLMEAVESKNEEMVEILISYGANPNQELKKGFVRTVLAVAVGKNALGIVRILLENGADVNHKERIQNGATCLKQAITKSSSISMVSMLLEAGADINIQDDNKQTPLFYAVQSGNPQVVEVLIRRGADLSVRDESGKTALLCSVEESEVDVTNMLLAAGADIDTKDDGGNTALLLAVKCGRMDTAQTLILKHASINIQNNEGFTALMVASESNTAYAEEIMRMLVNAGADVNAINQVDGVTTALSRALQKMSLHFSQTRVKIMTILLQSGASPSAAPSCAFAVHGATVYGSLHLVQLLIENGFGPLEIAGDTLYQITFEDRSIRDNIQSLSPVLVALLKGKARIARYLSESNFFTEGDARLSSAQKSVVRNYLVRNKLTNCLQIWDDLHSQPWTLFQLSFVSVSAAIGGGPNRRELIDQTPLPPILKRKLNFQGLEATSTYSQSEDDQPEDQEPGSLLSVSVSDLLVQRLLLANQMQHSFSWYQCQYNGYNFYNDSDEYVCQDSDDYDSDW